MRKVVVPLGCVMMLVGCVAAPDPSPSPSPVVSAVVTPVRSASPSPSPSPTPSPSSFPSYPADLPTQDRETAAIIAGWQEYWRVYEKFAADPFGFTDFTEINYVTTGEASRLTMDRIARRRAMRVKTVGPQRFRDVSVGPVSTADDGVREVLLTYCADSSAVRVVSIDTDKDQTPDGSRTYRETTKLRSTKPGDWRVESIENEKSSC